MGRESELEKEKLIQEAERLLREKGSTALKTLRKTISSIKIESKEAREALQFFNEKYPYIPSLFTATLLTLACEAVGGNSGIADSLAVPMILIRAGIDIHDDVIDKSKTKYGGPTIYGKFGKDIALLIGDALLFEGCFQLCKASSKISEDKMVKILDVIKQLFFELGDAEALELGLRGRMDVTPEEYLYVVRKKAADVESLLRIGAILGGGSKREIEALGNYGRMLGMLSLLMDDLQDLKDPKELSQRIKNECLPLPVIFALEKARDKTQKLLKSLEKQSTSKSMNQLLRTVNEANGLQGSKEIIKEAKSSIFSCLRSIKFRRSELTLLLEAVSMHNEGS